MNKQEAIETLDRLIRSRVPVIGIETYETHRVLEAVCQINYDNQRITRRQPKRVFTWSVSRGLWEVDCVTLTEELKVAPASDAVEETFAIFQFVIDEHRNVLFPDASDDDSVAAIYILKDPVLQGPAVARSLRDAAEVLEHRMQTLILVAPHLDIPQEAQKDVKVMSWPLPDSVELQDIVENFIDEQGIKNQLGGDMSTLVDALKGLNAIEADQVLAQSAIKYGVLDSNAIRFCLELKKDVVSQSDALEYYQQQVKDSEVGGLDRLRGWLTKAGKAMSPEAKQFGISPPRGVLVAGVPGCGKSLTAKMVASIWNVPLIRLDIGALFDSLLGKTESKTREALKIISAIGRCVVWVDEVEKALGSGGGELDGGTSARMFGTLLTAMEESLATSGAFLFATANEAWKLKPEFVRRFSKVFFVDLPNEEDRISIFEIHLAKTGRDAAMFDVGALAQFTENFTGSEIEGVVQSALWTAFAEGDTALTDTRLVEAISNHIPLATTMKEAIEKMRKWAVRAEPASTKQVTGRAVTVQKEVKLGRRLEM